MFRVKICGVTSAEDALLCAEAGADAIGLNFYPGSPRYVTVDQAREIVAAVKSRAEFSVATVGVFVNAPAAEIAAIVREIGLDWVQLHGEESPDEVAAVRRALGKDVGLIRAYRPGKMEDIEKIGDEIRRIELQFGAGWPQPRGLDGILVDARSERGRGGTGERADWSLAAALGALLSELNRQKPGGDAYLPRLILAGGLEPDNVGDAIRTVRPDAVDVASRVESAPGRKDPAKVRLFVKSALEAFHESRFAS